MKIKNAFKYLFLVAAMAAGLSISANATIPFAAPYGNGNVTQDSYNETADIDSSGLGIPVVSWSQWPDGMGGTNYNITVDTDYGTGLFTVGYTVAPYYESVQVYIY